MKPRTPPNRDFVRIHAAVRRDLDVHCLAPRYSPGLHAAKAFWKVTRIYGIPDEYDHLRIVRVLGGQERGDWRIYVIDVAGIWMGIVESIDGQALILESMLPCDSLTMWEVFELVRERIGSN